MHCPITRARSECGLGNTKISPALSWSLARYEVSLVLPIIFSFSLGIPHAIGHSLILLWRILCLLFLFTTLCIARVGGMTSGDHVDIMGNHELLGDMLKIVSGLEEEVDERIISHVREMSARVRIGDHN